MISCKTFADALRRFAISESSFAESSAGKAHAMVESANSNVLTATKELPNISMDVLHLLPRFRVD
jgi:hypothetical protein